MQALISHVHGWFQLSRDLCCALPVQSRAGLPTCAPHLGTGNDRAGASDGLPAGSLVGAANAGWLLLAGWLANGCAPVLGADWVPNIVDAAARPDVENAGADPAAVLCRNPNNEPAEHAADHAADVHLRHG